MDGGRPSLTERRKAETELEIARQAAALFAERGVESTTAEQIARAAGVAPRTFYRYFRAKEDAIAPLLFAGGRQWVGLLAAQPDDLPPAEAMEAAAVAALTVLDGDSTEGLEWTRRLLRAMPDSPALRSVWHGVNEDFEEQLIPVLAARLGAAVDPLEVRLAAAAATAAIRVALETWALGDAPPTGPHGPAALAARGMRELTSGLRLRAL
jgi:AcrR family transcriptional regulator